MISDNIDKFFDNLLAEIQSKNDYKSYVLPNYN